MIQKLRWKFTAAMMTIAFVFLFIIFTTLYYSTKMNFAQRSMETLQSAMMENKPVNAPDGFIDEKPPKHGPPPVRKEEALAVIADVFPTGDIVIVKNMLSDIEESDILALISQVNRKNTKFGVLTGENLRFLTKVSGRDGTIRYAFADISGETSSLYQQIIHSLIIGIASLTVFFPASICLSKWMTKPVEEAWNRQRQFVADASHELKTPLTVILSNSNMLIASNCIHEEKNIKRMDNIKAESIRMKKLVENLLNLAKFDADTEIVTNHAMDFSFTAYSSILTLEPVIYDAGKELSYHIEDSVWMRGNPEKLRQLIDILLDNACKYSNENSCIQFSLAKISSKEVLVSITSQGNPLTKEELKQIFLRFYRVSSSRSGKPGYGLGLSIASSIVAKHRGKIWAQSDGKNQNTFFVKLPCISKPENDEDGIC